MAGPPVPNASPARACDFPDLSMRERSGELQVNQGSRNPAACLALRGLRVPTRLLHSHPVTLGSPSSLSPGNCIQRMRRTPPLDELQPPPYQDDSGSPHLSCTPSEVGDSKCEFSHCSNSPRRSYGKCPSEGSTGPEAESFHNKGFEEDVPSDSTAVLSPEVSGRSWAQGGGGGRWRWEQRGPSRPLLRHRAVASVCSSSSSTQGCPTCHPPSMGVRHECSYKMWW
ncbi:Synaptotagmin-14 [Galemys pyrenaicus]|uniref:Synaptotagmin-14 n=1 Tax=Galemys pyrenaicus TaxID=202257 RepID=A0A8J5ZSF7_GALPY|nr:Synaptotagmin-14 [Galemys pyrenaicus]